MNNQNQNDFNLEDHLITTRSKITCLLFAIEAMEQRDEIPRDILNGIFGIENTLNGIEQDLTRAIDHC